MSSSGPASAGLNRPVSRSTELLHVIHQDSATGRRSWDSLIPDKRKTVESPGTSGPEGVTDERTRFSMCGSPTTAFGSSSPWVGGPSESRGSDTPTRLLLGCTMPRSILALSERPVTYEEELEERLGLLRVSAKTLYQRLAEEKKRSKELTHQLNARELTYRGVIEKMRSQYDQRFERLKNRARLLVTRCELMRSEKQQLEGRLAQAAQGAVRERQAMERRITSLEDEVERLRSERDDQELPVLRVVEDADIEEEEAERERKAEEENRRANKEEDKATEEKQKETAEKEKINDGGQKIKVNEDEQEEKEQVSIKAEEKEEHERDLEDIMRWRKLEIGSANDHYRILCEIAVARVAWLEDLLRSTMSGISAKSLSSNNYILLDHPSPLTRRSSSCPMLVTGSPRRPSEGEGLSPIICHPDLENGSDYSKILRPKKDFPREGLVGLTGSDRDSIIRLKASTIATTRLANSQSMPPTIGRTKTARTSTAAIRHSLQKLFASGRPTSDDPTLTQDGTHPRVTTRINAHSDDEPTPDSFQVDASRHGRRNPKKGKDGGAFEIPMFRAKRTASLPRVELFKKFQTMGRQDRDAPTLVWYEDAPKTSQLPLTKQERLLGVRLDHLSSEKVSPTSGLAAELQETPTIQVPLTKQERILGVRLDRSTSDKASSPPVSTADVQEAPTSQAPLTKQERVLGVRLDRVASDKEPPISSFAAEDLMASLSSHVNKESTESLPDKVLDPETEISSEGGTVKRNRSVHSTFGRLHERRNGVTDIARVEPKTTTKPPSPLDHFGKNLKHYLH